MVMRQLGLAAFLVVSIAGIAEAKHLNRHSHHSTQAAEHNGGGLASVYASGRDGYSGGRSALLVKRKGESAFQSFDVAFGVRSPSKFTNVVLREGDELYYRTPGGGGFGDPRQRDPMLIREDLADGYISREAAERDYGLAPETAGNK